MLSTVSAAFNFRFFFFKNTISKSVSYFLVQQALKPASASPLPPPPTASSDAQLQSVMGKQYVLKTCFHMDFSLQPTSSTTQNIPICVCTVHLHFHSHIPQVFSIQNMGQFSLFELISSRSVIQKTDWIPE